MWEISLQDLNLSEEALMAIQFLLALIAVFLLFSVFVIVMRIFLTTEKKHISMDNAKEKEVRIKILNKVSIDENRSMVLVQYDDKEHLLMTGGSTDVVIESNIQTEQLKSEGAQKQILGHEVARRVIAQRPLKTIPLISSKKFGQNNAQITKSTHLKNNEILSPVIIQNEQEKNEQIKPNQYNPNNILNKQTKSDKEVRNVANTDPDDSISEILNREIQFSLNNIQLNNKDENISSYKKNEHHVDSFDALIYNKNIDDQIALNQKNKLDSALVSALDDMYLDSERELSTKTQEIDEIALEEAISNAINIDSKIGTYNIEKNDMYSLSNSAQSKLEKIVDTTNPSQIDNELKQLLQQISSPNR